MAVAGCGIADTDGIQLTENSVVFFTGSGTLDSSNVVQVNFDTTVFTGIEGRARLALALELMAQRIQTVKVWPVSTAS